MSADFAVPDAPLSVTVRRGDSSTHVIASGELDLSTVDRMQAEVDAVLAAHPPVMVIDLGGVTFLDSAGVMTLVHACKQATADGVGLTVINPQPFVRQVLAVTGVLTALTGDG